MKAERIAENTYRLEDGRVYRIRSAGRWNRLERVYDDGRVLPDPALATSAGDGIAAAIHEAQGAWYRASKETA
jgi:hypothetical protein